MKPEIGITFRPFAVPYGPECSCFRLVLGTHVWNCAELTLHSNHKLTACIEMRELLCDRIERTLATEAASFSVESGCRVSPGYRIRESGASNRAAYN